MSIYNQFIKGFQKQSLVLKNSVRLLIGEIFNKLSGLFLGIWIARSVGPEQFGDLNYIKSFVILFGILTDFGLGKLLVRHGSTDKQELGNIFSHLLLLKIFFGVITFFSLRAVAYFGGVWDQYGILLLIYCGYYVLKLIAEFIRMIFRPVESMHQETFLKVLTGTIFFVIFFVGVGIRGNSLFTIFLSYLTAAIINLLISLIYIARKFAFQPFKLDKVILKKYIKSGSIITINILFVQVYSYADQLLLGNMASKKELGLYSAACKLYDGFLMLVQVYVNAALPNFLKDRDRSKLIQQSKFLLAGSIVSILGTALLGGRVINLIYGNAYGAATSLFLILTFALVFKAQNSLLSNILIGLGKEKKSLIAVATGAVINLGINIWGIPIRGAKASARGEVISAAVVCTIVVYYIISAKRKSENII